MQEVLPELHYIANVTDGTVLGYKYFEFFGLKNIQIVIRGNADGKITVYRENPKQSPVKTAGETAVKISEEQEWNMLPVELVKEFDGILPVYYRKICRICVKNSCDIYRKQKLN